MFGYCLGIILFNHITKYNLKKTLETRESLAMLPTLPIFPLKKGAMVHTMRRVHGDPKTVLPVTLAYCPQ